MTREERDRIEKHFDELNDIASGLNPHIPDEIRAAMKAAYVAGADYALDTVHHWISVEDELPKIGWTMSDTVVVTDGNGGLRFAWYHQDEGWHFETGLPFEPTHWMAMPQRPVVSKMESTKQKGGES